MTILHQVKHYADHAHHGQYRKYTGDPYIIHPIEVAKRAAEFFKGTDFKYKTEIVSAAYLHDVVEDTPIQIEEISKLFGNQVAKYVWFLTKPPGFTGNRAERKELDRARLSLAPPEVRVVKYFDIQHNSESIKIYDASFYKVFYSETSELLEAMKVLDIDFSGKRLEDYRNWL